MNLGLGDIASIATLILFVFYFIGRMIIIIRNRSVFLDEFKMEEVSFNRGGFDIVKTFELERNPVNAFILTSRNGIYNLSVYRIQYSDDLKFVTREQMKDYKYDFLNIGQSLEFLATSPELRPLYEVEYYTPDYKKVIVSLWDNPKNGIMSESATPQITFKSVLFHLFN